MRIKSLKGNELNFRYSGTKSIYVLDHPAFKGQFDKDGNNDWDKSTGKKELAKWATENLPSKILGEYEVDIATCEEVFSQKMLNLYVSSSKFKSKQFRLFQNSDNRMMESDGEPMRWWTRSACDTLNPTVWNVEPDGSIFSDCAYFTFAFVPVLRKKAK